MKYNKFTIDKNANIKRTFFGQKRKTIGIFTIVTVSIFGRFPSNIKLFSRTIRTRKQTVNNMIFLENMQNIRNSI